MEARQIWVTIETFVEQVVSMEVRVHLVVTHHLVDHLKAAIVAVATTIPEAVGTELLLDRLLNLSKR